MREGVGFFKEGKPMNDSILRGDLYYADLNPVVGSEQGGVRPCLIIQNNTGNRFSPTVIVAAITSKVKPHLPTHLPINCPPELGHTSVVLLEQLRTIDKSRLGRYVGSIGLDAMRLVDAALAVSLDMKRGKAPKLTVMTLCRTCKMQFEDSGFATQLIGSLTDAKDTCDFCNHRRGFDYCVRQK
jgi:mRNA interferase MazF